MIVEEVPAVDTTVQPFELGWPEGQQQHKWRTLSRWASDRAVLSLEQWGDMPRYLVRAGGRLTDIANLTFEEFAMLFGAYESGEIELWLDPLVTQRGNANNVLATGIIEDYLSQIRRG